MIKSNMRSKANIMYLFRCIRLLKKVTAESKLRNSETMKDSEKKSIRIYFCTFYLILLVTKEGNIKQSTAFMNALKIPEMTSWP